MVSLVKGVGIGAALGAGAGALASDDGYGVGALRGGVAGAAAGGLVHGVPKGINAAYKASGIERPTDGMLSNMISELGKAYKPLVETINTAEGKDIFNSLSAGLKKSAKDNPYNDSQMAFDAVKNNVDYFKNNAGSIKDFTSKAGAQFTAAGKYMEDNPAVKELQDYVLSAAKAYGELSGSKKVGVMTGVATDASLRSVKSHLIDPMVDLGRNLKNGDFKKINWEQGGALGFNALGLYETAGAVNDIADGNYGSAAGKFALIGAGKLGYGLGVSGYQANSLIKKQTGQSIYGLRQTMKKGDTMARYRNGMENMGEEQAGELAELLKGVKF